MVVKDSNGHLVDLQITGSWPDDVEIESAVYIENGLDVCDDEKDFILTKHYTHLTEELLKYTEEQDNLFGLGESNEY